MQIQNNHKPEENYNHAGHLKKSVTAAAENLFRKFNLTDDIQGRVRLFDHYKSDRAHDYPNENS